MFHDIFGNAAKGAALVSILLLSGCATAYQSEGMTGGFHEEQKAQDQYLVTFNGNGFTTPERASDFAMMRGAELTLMHGYKYFVVFNSNTAMNEDDIYTGYAVSASFKPTSKYLILATRTPPTQFKTYFDAGKFFADTAHKYAVEDKLPNEFPVPKQGPFSPDASVIKFDFKDGLALPPGAPDQLTLYTDPDVLSGRDWYMVGDFTYYENPVDTQADFVQQVRAELAKQGVNGLLIVADPAKVQSGDVSYGFEVPKTAGFLAEALYFPQGSLGVIWEPGALRIGEYIVRTYKGNVQPQKGGLLLGDKVLDVDGIDVLKRDQIFKVAKDWKPGDTVSLTVVRNGQEQTVSQTLVPNT